MTQLSTLIESEIADFFAGFGGPVEPDIQSGEAQRLLTDRINGILAAEAQEPVAMRWRWKDDGMNEVGDWIYHAPKYFEQLNASGTRLCEPLYAAPQPVAVPDERVFLRSDEIERHTLTAGDCPPQSKVMLVSSINRLNACRAAMLKGDKS